MQVNLKPRKSKWDNKALCFIPVLILIFAGLLSCLYYAGKINYWHGGMVVNNLVRDIIIDANGTEEGLIVANTKTGYTLRYRFANSTINERIDTAKMIVGGSVVFDISNSNGSKIFEFNVGSVRDL